MSIVDTVGIFLTEDERRHLTNLATDLEVREQSSLRSSEGQEAATYAAEREALLRLMYIPVSAVDAAIASDREQLVSAMQFRARVIELRAEWVRELEGQDPYEQPDEYPVSAFVADLDAVLGETNQTPTKPDSDQVFRAVHDAVLHYQGEGFALAALIAERAVQRLGGKP